ncbi:hypothetical protein B0H10DRAFT_2079513 [Mycena sp. CBHHK59/15]|nr:hypothetical protein B0H10DRAFT_2079513 [Mycena sp. CBHHK59/15]
MSTSANRPLRILYSLNGSPQYILARSQGAVPVELIPSQGNGVASSSRSTTPPPSRYATASLKTCLNTICRSSPEIIQDRGRDFSVYLLDPLETDCAPAQVKISHSLSNPLAADAPEARVAVGLGLMSWGLLADESEAMSVAGTLRVTAAGQEMLEIIFSLRETIPMQKASLPDALRSWGLPSNAHASSSSTASVSALKGRKPAAFVVSKRKSRKQPPKLPPVPVTESERLLAASDHYVGPERRPAGRPRVQRSVSVSGAESSESDDVVVIDGPTTNNPSYVQRSDEKPDPSPILDFLAFLNAITPEMERNKALGKALGLVHGANDSSVRPPPELADAMTLISDLQRQSQSSHQSSPEAPQSNSQHRRKSSSHDDEIVVLNKENVNPTAFRRRTEREREDTKLGTAEPSEGSASSPPNVPRQSSSRLQEASRVIADQPLSRKRTLSEFMEEQECNREKEKSGRRNYYRQPERSLSESSSRYYKHSANPTNYLKPPQSSPPRPASWTSSPGPSVGSATATSTVVAPPPPRPSASSPVRPSAQPRKKYVVPAWAQTGTATQPRLSDRVIQRMKEEEMEKKRTEKESRRVKEKEKPKEDKPGKPGPPLRTAQKRTSSAPLNRSEAKVPPLPAPVAANGEFSIFSGAIGQTSRPPSDTPPGQLRSPAVAANNLPPSTPPRKRRATITSPADSNSLFTPATGSWEASGVLNLGRRSMSPSSRKVPTQETNPPQPGGENESQEDDDLLSQELDSAFDEFDFPLSSLPAASSDIEVDVEPEHTPGSNQDYDSDDSDDDGPPKQHWVGLPPSSPPPPSSPFLTGESPMDDDVEEFSLTAPRADHGSELETVDSPDPDPAAYSVEELKTLFKIDDFANFYPSTHENIDIQIASLFDQYTNHSGAPEENSQTMMDLGLDPTANPDFDFTEFWESVKPLVEANSEPTDVNMDLSQSSSGGLDHTKLAGDVHALFSGCLV